jgi:predicted DsbA family dithiol-disulfide isomerase
MKERLMLAYFTESVAIGDPAALLPLAVEVGLPGAEVRRVLEGDEYAAEVRADEQQAREIGISGVPFFVLDQRLAISGAQPGEVFTQALEQAWSTRETTPNFR